MALTLAEVILAVRDRHPDLDAYRAPSGVLARALSDAQRLILTRYADVRPEEVESVVTAVVPLAGADAGVAIPPRVGRVRGTFVADGGTEQPLFISDFSDRFTPRRFPSVYTRGDAVFLRGSDWPAGELRLRLVPVPDDLATMQTAFVLPARAKGALVSQAAHLMVVRGGLAVEQIGPYAQQAERELKLLLEHTP